MFSVGRLWAAARFGRDLTSLLVAGVLATISIFSGA
jgi:hypothetical protein